MNPNSEFRRDVALTLVSVLGIDPERAKDAAWAVTHNWRVERINTPNKDHHSLAEVPYGHYLRISTDWQPETLGETTEREARHEARMWGLSHDDDQPPPPRTRILDLLDQDIWWLARVDGRATSMRLADMGFDHKVSLLAWLRARASRFHGQLGTWLGDAPDDVWASWSREDSAEWLEDQPLIKALVWHTTPVGCAPLTWQPLREAPAGRLAIVRRGGRDEQAWAVRLDGEWWQIDAQGYTRIPPTWFREPDNEWRPPWDEDMAAAGYDLMPQLERYRDRPDVEQEEESADAY